jgi:hypothetical protein
MSGPHLILSLTALIQVLITLAGHVPLLHRTCPVKPKSSVTKSQPDLLGLLIGFLKVFSNMSGLSPLSRVKAPEPDMSGFQDGFQRWLPDMSRPSPDMSKFLTPPTGRFPWGGGVIKGLPCLPSLVGHSVQLANTLRHSLEL